MSKVRWQDRITNEEVRKRCGVENLEHRLGKMRLRWFGYVKRRDENSILGERWSWRWRWRVKDMRKLNITDDMAEDRKQWRKLISCPIPEMEN